ncbi:MAG: hypothetical protein FWG88_03435 [Oscillospiraceae bacterium]|nr:hypothetical protein [Oscillospiraceae bacterium]
MPIHNKTLGVIHNPRVLARLRRFELLTFWSVARRSFCISYSQVQKTPVIAYISASVIASAA